MRHAAFLELVQWLDAISSGLHVGYQLYFDDWAVTAHVVEPSLDTHLSDEWGLRTALRFYYQSAAFFWQRAYVVSQPDAIPLWRTADRDLSTYMAGSLSARLEWHLPFATFYVDATGTYTGYFEFLYRDHLLQIVTMVGARMTL